LLQRIKIRQHADLVALTPRASSNLEIKPKDLIVGSAAEIIRRYWKRGGVLIVIGAVGAVMRLIAPLITNKEDDPAVIVLDSLGRNVVPILGGHKAGADSFALQLAEELGGNAVITGDTSTKGTLAIDSFGEAWGWKRSGSNPAWNQLMLHQTGCGTCSLLQQSGSQLWVNSKAAAKSFRVNQKDNFDKKKCLIISSKASDGCCWHPPTLWIGIGCERNTSGSLLRRALKNTLLEVGLAREAIAGLASIDIKSDESSLLSFAQQSDWPIRYFNSKELSNIDVPTPSKIVNSIIGTPSVSEASALLAAGVDAILLTKKHVFQAKDDEIGAVTIAIAEASRPFAPHRGELHLIGSGPGELAYLTPDAKAALARSVVWIGYGRYLDLLEPLRRSDQVRLTGQLTFELDRCKQAIELARQGIRVSLVSSGDSGIYGMAGLALELLLDDLPNIRPSFSIHPGISALQVAAAKVGAPLMNDFCTISLSDRLTPWDTIKERLRGASMGDFVMAIYNPRSKDRDWQLQSAIDIVRQYRSAKTPIVLARQVARVDEKIHFYTLDAFPINKVDMLTIILIGNSQSVVKDRFFLTPRGYLKLEHID